MASLLLASESDLQEGRKPDPNDQKRMLSHWDAEGLYWAGLEIPFYRFLDQLPEAPQVAVQRWKDDLRMAVRGAFEKIVSMNGNNAKALKASAKAQAQLNAGLKKILEQTL